MIGTKLAEELVQAVALSHRIKHYDRASLLLLAGPENGKTTITTAAHAKHITQVAVISGRSVMREIKDHPHTEFLLFNDLASIRAMSVPAANLLIMILNQLTQDERGIIAFAGREAEEITRPVGVIGCLPFKTFLDQRTRWREVGFVSRMIPFAYQYRDDLIAQIKHAIDTKAHHAARQPTKAFPRKIAVKPVEVSMTDALTRHVREMADERAKSLKQIGIRLLRNYHAVIRARALLHGRREVTADDVLFLRSVDAYVSITDCREL